MTDFVLKQEQEYANVTRCVKKNLFLLIVDYAKFMKQPLTLGMFVPCYDGNILFSKPNYYDCFLNGSYVNHPQLINYENCVRYKKAEEKVLFEGVKIGRYGNGMFHFTGLGKSYLIIDGFIYDDNQNSAPQKTEDKIEDLLQWNENLELTESAIRQIGIEKSTSGNTGQVPPTSTPNY